MKYLKNRGITGPAVKAWLAGRGRADLVGLVLAAVMLVALANSSSAAAVGAAPSFVDRVKFGTGRDTTRAVATADLDLDGDLDLVVGNSGQGNAVYLNTGGSFSAGRPFGTDGDATVAIALGDLNGDGYPEIVAANQGQSNLVYWNDGQAGFSRMQRFGPTDGKTRAIALGDLDSNGRYDIVAANDGQNYIYPVDEAGNLGNPIPLGPATGLSMAVVLADMDRQNGLDVVVANDDAQNAIFFNDGQGDFSRASLPFGSFQAGTGSGNAVDRLKSTIAKFLIKYPGLDAAAVAAKFGLQFASSTSMRVADLNGDGLLDVIVGHGDGANSIYLGQEGGNLGSAIRFGDDNSATWSVDSGDLDGDGDIDVVTANIRFQENVIFLNDGQGNLTEAGDFGTGSDSTRSAVLGDFDADGYLDIAVGNYNQQNAVYLNDGEGILVPSQQLAGNLASASQVIMGDVDGDGYLDAILATNDYQDRISGYDLCATGNVTGHALQVLLNDGQGELLAAPDAAIGPQGNCANDVAAGDLDGNGQLDFVLANANAPNTIYLKQADGSYLKRELDPAKDDTRSVAVGDLDGDGDLDVVVGNAGQANAAYLNAGQATQWTRQAFGDPALSNQALALGDLDRDGDLDVVTGNSDSRTGEGQQDVIYLNDGLGNLAWSGSQRTFGNGSDNTQSVALADLDGDGYLDIVAVRNGLDGGQDAAFMNDGTGRFDGPGSERRFGLATEPTANVAVGDVDGDGDRDIITDRALYLNDGRGNFSVGRGLDPTPEDTRLVALGDLDGDGTPDVVLADRQAPLMVYASSARGAPEGPGGRPILSVGAPDASQRAGFGSSATILDSIVIPVSYAFGTGDLAGGQPAILRGCYSLDGGGHWRVAVPDGSQALPGARLVTPASGCPYVPGLDVRPDAGSADAIFPWNIFASGVFGQSDNVVLRLEALPDQRPTLGGLPPASQRPYASAETWPFRVRGTQVRVFDETTDKPAAGAVVFRLPAGQVTGGEALGTGGRLFRTNNEGYLQGRGVIGEGDRLVALLPDMDRSTSSYVTYRVSAHPTTEGLDARPVEAPGVQELVVSAGNPLVLFNLDVSLEWDARQDGPFLGDLEEAIRRASEILYDVSDGQMALGRVTVYQNKERWLQAGLKIFAQNGVRPRASMGGVVQESTDDTKTRSGQVIADAFRPGQVRMGPLWDPYGESRADLARDWWRALAHELGHHFLYLPDNYLGYNEDGAVIRTDCFGPEYGSIMTTAYDEWYSEFLDFSDLDPQDWPGDCANTVAAKTTQRSDWETITAYYPMVETGGDNPGPATLPINVTQLRFPSPAGTTATLPARNFDLRERVQGEDTPGKRKLVPQGQTYLFKAQGTQDPTDDVIEDLGTTGNTDRIKVRGASPGDRVCVFDNSGEAALIGCLDDLTPLTTSIPVAEVSDWSPNIAVQPGRVPVMSLAFNPQAGEGQSPVTAQVLAGDGQASVQATQSPSIWLVRYQPQDPAPGDLGYTLALGWDTPQDVSQPVLNARQLGGESVALDVTQPQAPDQSGTVQVSRPTLEVRVTEDHLASETLGVQVLPGYQVFPYMFSPVSTMDADDDAATRRASLMLSAPTYSGYIRVWVDGEEGTREAVSQFVIATERLSDGTYSWGDGSGMGLRPDRTLNWQALGSLGIGANDITGMGANDITGMGANDITGMGANDITGMGANDITGMGADDITGMGANDITGMGANDITGMGANDITGMGANDITGMGADVPGLYANQRVLGAPIASEDGRVTIFNRLDALAGDTGTALLESLPTVPNRPDWLTPVGKTIRFVPSGAGQDIARIIEFGYLRREVPRGYEHTLKVYFSGDDGATWTPLPTDLDLDDAQATASADEEGLYVLGATVEIPLYSAGWNLFAYPIPAETSVAKALQNIEGMYTTMYGYDSKSPDDPWRIYNEDLPDWVSDVPDVSLDTLEYGQGYWIWVNGPLEEPLVLRLPVAEGRPLEPQAQPVVGQEAPTAKRMPPALYFGTLDASPEVVAAAGDAITAWIDLGSGARLCGIGSVVPGDAEGTYRYVVKVDAADQGTDAVCGAPGRTVSFKLGEESLPFSAPWDNSEPQAASLSQTGKTPPGPEPSPEPQFDSCRELVRNGGFEQSGSWTILGGPRRATYSTDQAAAGDRSLLLGGPPGEPLPYLGPDRRASAHQWISVPRTAGRVLLSFSYLPGNAGASDSTQRAMVLRPGDLNVVMSVLEDSAGWKTASADLSAYKGQTVALAFDVVDGPDSTPGSTWMYVDDVSVLACE